MIKITKLFILFSFLSLSFLSCQKDKGIDNHAVEVTPFFNLKVNLNFSEMNEDEIAYYQKIKPRISAVFYQHKVMNTKKRLPDGRIISVKERYGCSNDFEPKKNQMWKIHEAHCDLEEWKNGFTCIHYSKGWGAPKLQKNVPYTLCLFLHDKYDYYVKPNGYGTSAPIRIIMKDNAYYFQQGPFDHDDSADNRNFFNGEKEVFVRYNGIDKTTEKYRRYEYPYAMESLLIYPFTESTYTEQFKNLKRGSADDLIFN